MLRIVKDVPERAGKRCQFKQSVPVSVKYAGSMEEPKNMEFEAYLSTFGNVDRDGDVVVRGAFNQDLREFMKNPVMLIDHRNSIENVVGKFTDVREDDKGLYVKGIISNAPDVLSVRVKMAEGLIKALSMGGYFQWDEDGVHITRVKLHEGSLVAIPANPEALII